MSAIEINQTFETAVTLRKRLSTWTSRALA
jgi:hypothetical protein